jgi:hypothetical protein
LRGADRSSGAFNLCSEAPSLGVVGATRYGSAEIRDRLQPFLERVRSIRWSHLSHANPARMLWIAPLAGDHGVSCMGSWPDPFAKGSPV